MTAKVCLRCDWSGATASDVCPRCGAALYGSGPSAVPPARGDHGGPRDATAERPWRGIVAMALVVAFAAGAVVFVQRHTPPTPIAPPSSELGYLVYAADDASGQTRLWVWNLSASTMTTGPAIPAIPTELLFTYAMTSGWVGLTNPTGSGELRASVLHDLEPETRPDTVARGQMIAWLPSEGIVTLVDAPRFGGCHHAVRVVTSDIGSAFRKRSLNQDVCGDPTAVGRSLTVPYLTIERAGRPAVYAVGNDELRPVLRGYRALSVSLNGDLLVQHAGSDRPLAYYYPSTLEPAPTPIGPRWAPLLPERVLGWDGAANNAYVLGSVGGVRGVYRIAVSPRVRPRSPDLILRTLAEDVSVSLTPTGGVYVSAGGTVTFVQESERQVLAAPGGAPTPTGPVLWMSTLPYSPSVAG
jgi:hypothetical protein